MNLRFTAVVRPRKAGKGPAVGGLSRVAELRRSDPTKRSRQYPGAHPSVIEITVRVAPESVSSFDRDPRQTSNDSIRGSHGRIPR